MLRSQVSVSREKPVCGDVWLGAAPSFGTCGCWEGGGSLFRGVTEDLACFFRFRMWLFPSPGQAGAVEENFSAFA